MEKKSIKNDEQMLQCRFSENANCKAESVWLVRSFGACPVAACKPGAEN